VLVVAFFAAPAVADCTGPNSPVGIATVDFSLGTWPANANVDLVSSEDQRAFAFWNGDATNDVTVEKDQSAGMVYSALGPTGAEIDWDTRVVNIEKISSGNQFATATGYATAKNSISVCSTQGTGPGCACCTC
jgi:hypothetical protein